MNDNTFQTCIGAVMIAACYIAYVVSTHGNGIALAAACTAIGSIISGGAAYGYAHRKGFQAGLLARTPEGD